MARKPRTPAASATQSAPVSSAVPLSGEWTIYQAAALRDQLRELLAAVPDGGTLEADLSGITDIDSAGFQLLVAARHSAAALGRQVTFSATSRAVDDLAATYAYRF